jgi:hypothetical protein
MRVRFFTASVALAACVVMMRAQSPATSHSCILVQELSAPKPLYARGGAQCSTQLAPASTFKMPHALVALETGVVTTTSIEKWDSTKYPRQLKWNRNHTVISAQVTHSMPRGWRCAPSSTQAFCLRRPLRIGRDPDARCDPASRRQRPAGK